MSLYHNLKKCLHIINHIRQTYTKLPLAVNDHLTNIENKLILCQCACVEEEAASSVDEPYSDMLIRTYSSVLETLDSSISSSHTLLQLYFSKSPHWEHYYRNITEITALLSYILYPNLLKTQQDDQKWDIYDSSDEEWEDSEDDEWSCDHSAYSVCSNVPVKFYRTFVPMKKVALSRHWTVSWKQRYFVLC